MQTLKNVLNQAVDLLESFNILNSKFSSEMLLSSVLQIKRADLYLFFNKRLTAKEIKQFHAFIERRKNNEPLEYIIGSLDFYGVKISVNKNVLIPRVETELLVDEIATLLEKENLDGKVLLDICCGSGCIGISLKKKFPKLKVFILDISKEALEIAKKNASQNKVEVFFKQGDLLNPIDNIKADFAVCNPPYVSKKEYDSLDASVKDFEPKTALVAKEDGLEFYKRLEKDLKKYLRPKAKIFFEIGYKQKEDILKIFCSSEWKNKKVIKDYSSTNRFFFVEIE